MSCPQCFQGHLHQEQPFGVVRNIHGLQTYIASPKDTSNLRGIIIMVPDAFGWDFVNNRLLADQYATKGNFSVYLPDFMDGRPAPLWLLGTMAQLSNPDLRWSVLRKPWYMLQLIYGIVPFFLHNRFGLAWPRIRSFVKAVRAANIDLPIGAAGFCWGGRPVLHLAHPESTTADGKPFVDAVFTGHPSALSLPGDAERVLRPVAMAIGDRDSVMAMPQVDIVRNSWEKLNSVPTEIVIYPGAGHGFCVRVDPHNKSQVQQSKEAAEQAVVWLRKYLVSSTSQLSM